MGTKLYVGNLNYNTTEASLREAFGGNGREVRSVQLIIDRETGRPRGFAFVDMATPEFAQQALAELDGQELEGRTLRINEAREQARGPGGGGPGGPPRTGGFSPRPSGGFAGGGGSAPSSGGGAGAPSGGPPSGGGGFNSGGPGRPGFGPPRAPGGGFGPPRAGGRFDPKKGTGRKDRDKPRGEFEEAGAAKRGRQREFDGDDDY
jgi:RNA recognition motif-containing protein